MWGAVHGSFLALERAGLGRVLDRLPRVWGHVYTLLVVLAAWVLFRSDSLGRAGAIYAAMLGFGGAHAGASQFSALIDRQTLAALATGLVGATPAFSWLTRDWRERARQRRGVVLHLEHEAHDPVPLLTVRSILLTALALLSFAQIAASAYNPFIYFRF